MRSLDCALFANRFFARFAKVFQGLLMSQAKSISEKDEAHQQMRDDKNQYNNDNLYNIYSWTIGAITGGSSTTGSGITTKCKR